MVVGAGFVTGRELVSFFGVQAFVIFIPIFAVLIMVSNGLVFTASKKYCGLERLNKNLFGKKEGFTSKAILLSSFILLTAMLSSIDAIFESFSAFNNLPLASLITLILAVLVCRKGIAFLKGLSLILMPLLLVALNLSIFTEPKFNFSVQLNFSNLTYGVAKSILYVCMSVFTSLPILAECGKDNGKKENIISSILIGIILSVQAVLILGKINHRGLNAIFSPMPLLATLQDGWIKIIFTVVLLMAVITSVFTSFYPLYKSVKDRGNKSYLVLLCVCAFMFSRLGLSKIVAYAYPLVAALGFVYLCAIVSSIFSKKLNKIGNILKSKRGLNMKGKKKNKVIKLTDEQYNNYIMSLKDEKPPILVRETKDE